MRPLLNGTDKSERDKLGRLAKYPHATPTRNPYPVILRKFNVASVDNRTANGGKYTATSYAEVCLWTVVVERAPSYK